MNISSTILHESSVEESQAADKNPLLVALGERVRMQRSRRGLTRKALAAAAGVSERHLANLEYGVGNASVLVLQQVADALACPVALLVGDVTTASPEWLLLREQLSRCTDAELQAVRQQIAILLRANYVMKSTAVGDLLPQRIALIGLRGAGKSTLGRMLAQAWNFPFFEMSAEIEKLAGSTVAEIQALFGANAYRRYERRVLEQLIAQHPQAVIATPGGLVSDVASFNLLLEGCTTVWLQADPKDHMQRVRSQGDTRPIAASREAMQDLQGILQSREAFYSKANFSLHTSRQGLQESFLLLQQLLLPVLER
jgi:XRE family transcriptional regulator, aerobic/anaerobic benzoate catabolism transcriptional regulator